MARKKKKTSEKEVKRPLQFREDGQEYVEVIKMLGGARFTGKCFDGKERLCIIRGSMSGRRKIWIKVGDICLVSLREWQDDKCDVILKYEKTEVKSLIAYGEIDSGAMTNNEGGNEDDDIGFDFVNEDEFDLEKNFDDI